MGCQRNSRRKIDVLKGSSFITGGIKMKYQGRKKRASPRIYIALANLYTKLQRFIPEVAYIYMCVCMCDVASGRYLYEHIGHQRRHLKWPRFSSEFKWVAYSALFNALGRTAESHVTIGNQGKLTATKRAEGTERPEFCLVLPEAESKQRQ